MREVLAKKNLSDPENPDNPQNHEKVQHQISVKRYHLGI